MPIPAAQLNEVAVHHVQRQRDSSVLGFAEFDVVDRGFDVEIANWTNVARHFGRAPPIASLREMFHPAFGWRDRPRT